MAITIRSTKAYGKPISPIKHQNLWLTEEVYYLFFPYKHGSFEYVHPEVPLSVPSSLVEGLESNSSRDALFENVFRYGVGIYLNVIECQYSG